MHEGVRLAARSRPVSGRPLRPPRGFAEMPVRTKARRAGGAGNAAHGSRCPARSPATPPLGQRSLLPAIAALLPIAPESRLRARVVRAAMFSWVARWSTVADPLGPARSVSG